MSLGHREQPKIGEEGIWPSGVIAKASTLTRTMKLSAQNRSHTATNKASDGREGVGVGVLEIAEPATQFDVLSSAQIKTSAQVTATCSLRA